MRSGIGRSGGARALHGARRDDGVELGDVEEALRAAAGDRFSEAPDVGISPHSTHGRSTDIGSPVSE
jgi:hypothetical protein